MGSIYDPTNEIIAERHYYPFGMEMNGEWFATVAPEGNYTYNGKEWNEAIGLLDYGARYYDPAIARFPSVDRFAEKFAWQSPYVYAGNNPIKFIDMNGDSIVGVNETSAQRALNIIQGSFGSGASAESMASLFSLGSDGRTFNGINLGDFKNALGGLSVEAQALAVGYYQAVNSTRVNVVEVVNRSESLSAYGQERTGAATGAELDANDGGGRYAQAVGYGQSWDGDYAAIVQNSQAQVSGYSDGVTRPSLPGELLAHEFLGHGPGGRYQSNRGNYEFGYGSGSAVQAGNLYLSATNRGYHRLDHGVARIPKNFSPTGIPQYLAPYSIINMIRR